MAAKKTKKAKKKKNLDGGDTPIIIGGGGGGGSVIITPLEITYDANVWQPPNPRGKLTLPGGNVKKIVITTGDFELKLPVNGDIKIDLKVRKPLPKKTSRP